MFANVGWGEMLVLTIVALVILGPERLPGAMQWCGNMLRQARDYVGAASKNLRDEFGTDFDDLREPLGELQKLRGMSPRSALTKHLLDGDDSILTGRMDEPSDTPPPAAPTKPQSAGGPTPFDTDAT